MVNQTIEHQLNHRSIRKFKAENLSDEQIKTLLEVARQTSTSNFFNNLVYCISRMRPSVNKFVILVSNRMSA